MWTNLYGCQAVQKKVFLVLKSIFSVFSTNMTFCLKLIYSQYNTLNSSYLSPLHIWVIFTDASGGNPWMMNLSKILKVERYGGHR